MKNFLRNVAPVVPSLSGGRACRSALLAIGASSLLMSGLPTVYAQTQPTVPRIIVISLDGATPRLINQFTTSGELDPTQGFGLLQNVGIRASRNVTVTPSLTAVAHASIATGANPAANDIIANSFRLVASPFTLVGGTISGFAAPIGGYSIDGPMESVMPTAEPIWVKLRQAGKKVVTATFPGGDGATIRVPGLPPTSPIIQSPTPRTVDYTVPFGAFAGPGATAFALNAAQFAPSPAIASQLAAAGRISFSPVKQANLETFVSGGLTYNIKFAALDTTDDNTENYDTLAFYEKEQGIPTGPFALPDTGPAYVKFSENKSLPYALPGHPLKAGANFYVTALSPDLSTVRILRTSANFIPRNAPVIGVVDDVNNNVGFWAPQPDFRIVQRVGLGAAASQFSDLELEAVYADLVKSFTDYQLRLVLRAIRQNPDADLVMVYFEQPDGSGHQYLLTDPRQPTDPTNANSIGAGQDPAKIARYRTYLANAYRTVNTALQAIINEVGVDANGKPKSNLFVTADHGFEPFHTAVNINQLLLENGMPASKVRAIISGPAVNVYINLKGREPNGTVSGAEYLKLQNQVADLLQNYRDNNPTYAPLGAPNTVFDKVYLRPADLNDKNFGRRTSAFIGQDGGDVLALLRVGYNFDGVQGNGIVRQGDPAAMIPVLSIPSFYGAHGYDANIPNMSAIFYAAGPDVDRGTLTQVRNIDIAPTIASILGVARAATVEGSVINLRSTPLQLQSAVSRKSHAALGDFDVTISLGGSAVESRRSGANGSHTLVLTFNNNVVTGNITLSAGTGNVASTVFNGNEMTVILSNIADTQRLTLTLSGIRDTWGNVLPSAAVELGILLGDINGDGRVNQMDINEVKTAASPGILTPSNFRTDVNLSGNVNTSDVAQTQSRSGRGLP